MEELELGNGLTLRLLSGMELLEARREARELCRDPREQPLCSNACLLARALGLDGAQGPVFADGREVLIGLTAEEIEGLCAKWDEFRRSQISGGASVEYGVNENYPQGKTGSPFRGEAAEDRKVGGGKP